MEMSSKDAAIVEIGNVWITRDDMEELAKNLEVSPDDVVDDKDLATNLDMILLKHFFNNKGEILKEVELDGTIYIYGRVAITYSGAPFKTYKRLFFRRGK